MLNQVFEELKAEFVRLYLNFKSGYSTILWWKKQVVDYIVLLPKQTHQIKESEDNGNETEQ